MFGGGEANYISWTGLSPNIFREHMAPLFSDLREERYSNRDINNNNSSTIINNYNILLYWYYTNLAGLALSFVGL